MIPYIVKSMKKPGTDQKQFYIQIAPTVPLPLRRSPRTSAPDAP